MGISIAYRGKLADPTLIPALVRDLAERAEAAGWSYETMETLLAAGHVQCQGLQGITLMPHRECEWLNFHFDAEGTFVNHHYQRFLADTEMAGMVRDAVARSVELAQDIEAGRKEPSKPRPGGKGSQLMVTIPDISGMMSPAFLEEGRRYNWTKTQFAGADVHIAVCALLRYVKRRYAPDLWIKDDSGYYEDGDRQKLESQLAHVERMISVAEQAVESVAARSRAPSSLSAFIDRLNEELAAADERLH